MSKETTHTTPEPGSEPLWATRRTALRGTGLAGLFTMGVGSASASEGTPETTVHQAKRQTAEKSDPDPVDYTNYVRAQTDRYFKNYADLGGFGQLYHYRTPIPIDEQVVAVEHRDVLASVRIFDLTDSVPITKLDTANRYQSMHVVNQDQYTKASSTSQASTR